MCALVVDWRSVSRHTRREIFEAEAADPEGVREGLRRIGALYDIEEEIRNRKLTGEAKLLHRLTHSKPHVEAFFDWVGRRLEAHGLQPKTPFINALHYARERRAGLEVLLTDADVSLDTNHLERALRVIPMGRKNYDPYGNRDILSGTVGSDIGYAGYFYHAASGLEFTLNRAYDPQHARWLNRGQGPMSFYDEVLF